MKLTWAEDRMLGILRKLSSGRGSFPIVEEDRLLDAYIDGKRSVPKGTARRVLRSLIAQKVVVAREVPVTLVSIAGPS